MITRSSTATITSIPSPLATMIIGLQLDFQSAIRLKAPTRSRWAGLITVCAQAAWPLLRGAGLAAGYDKLAPRCVIIDRAVGAEADHLNPAGLRVRWPFIGQTNGPRNISPGAASTRPLSLAAKFFCRSKSRFAAHGGMNSSVPTGFAAGLFESFPRAAPRFAEGWESLAPASHPFRP